MAWLQIHQSLPTHRKTMQVADTLDISPVAVVGHLASFWLWAIDNAPTGQLVGITEKAIARAAQWPGDAHVFVATLRAARFLDGEDVLLTIHDWDDYTGRLIAKRNANAERMRRERATHVPRTDAARAGAREEKSREEKNNIHLRGAEAPEAQQKRGTESAVKSDGAESAAKPDGKSRRETPPPKTASHFVVLARVCNMNLGRLTKSERGELNAAAAELATVGYSPENIKTMAANYAGHMGDCLMTPSALAKHATRLMQPAAPKNGRQSGPPAMTPEESANAYPEYFR